MNKVSEYTEVSLVNGLVNKPSTSFSNLDSKMVPRPSRALLEYLWEAALKLFPNSK